EITPEAVDLPSLVAGLTRGRRVLSPKAALACPARLLPRRRPGTMQLHDLGTMHETTAGEGDQIGLALAPGSQSCGPLLGTVKLVRVLAGQNGAAIDDPADNRGELAGRDRDHRLVEQRQPLREAPEPDQDVALLA